MNPASTANFPDFGARLTTVRAEADALPADCFLTAIGHSWKYRTISNIWSLCFNAVLLNRVPITVSTKPNKRGDRQRLSRCYRDTYDRQVARLESLLRTLLYQSSCSDFHPVAGAAMRSRLLGHG